MQGRPSCGISAIFHGNVRENKKAVITNKYMHDGILNYMKVGNLLIRKIFKINATRCQILRLKFTEFDFGWGSAQAPLEKLTALPQTP